ncbi:helix-turn-helix domain-containing protein [Frankia sp. CiP3]|uniref:helix-turn-helix domain-containing protein n=1 Tax=Frankia sp. CiP3 TaxID=2880971 RepID=UPI001EF4FC45|nr:helix-turn-helix domain-containing protein [Frankia sp. CiP3]
MTPIDDPDERLSDAVTLGAYLRRKRQEAGLSLRQLAARTGVSHSYLSRVEYGDYHHPAPGTLQRIAHVLGIDHTDLFALAGYIPPETLPTFAAYLAAKYEMPDQATNELRALFKDICRRYPVRERDPAPKTPTEQPESTYPHHDEQEPQP